jgi:hypothetical protein
MSKNRTTYPGLKIDQIYNDFEKNCEKYPKSRVKIVDISVYLKDHRVD